MLTEEEAEFGADLQNDALEVGLDESVPLNVSHRLGYLSGGERAASEPSGPDGLEKGLSG